MFHFGTFEFDETSGELRHGGQVRTLTKQTAIVLAALVASPGKFVSRAEIAARLWNGEVHVDEDAGINFVIRQLRAALGDNGTSPRFIETRPRQGYRLMVPVSTTPEPPQRPWWRPAVIAGAVALVVAAIVFAARQGTPTRRLLVEVRTDAAASQTIDRARVTDELVATLMSDRPGVSVIAPQVAAAYIDNPFPDVQRRLGLDLYLHVSFRSAGPGRFELHAKLVEAHRGTLLWVSS
jgi:DNA-binding winged helix-turn-helix (wHTH) protein